MSAQGMFTAEWVRPAGRTKKNGGIEARRLIIEKGSSFRTAR
jgi:hypothetical protein